MIRPAADHRRRLGRLGERVAADFLERRGVRILAVNRRLGRGEVDLVVEIAGERTVVEVKSIWTSSSRVDMPDPVDLLTEQKAKRLRALAGRLDPPAGRIDLVAVTFGPSGADVRWVPEVA